MLNGFNHLTLAVSDLERSLDFYSCLLNFRLAATWDSGAYLALGELWLCLSLDKGSGGQGGATYTHYAFSIQQSDFPAFRQRLKNSGVTEWQPNRSEGDSFYFLDPDGHQLEAHVGSLSSRLAQCKAKPYKGMRFFD
ncbi:fosfomycin resistance glutathione transferase [Duganella sp. BJB1802]|uniref:fosfomycin resistance glutathione transferase n=1 Tax=Duganella sp. BJB1802 TaxID=2744575 RepID=UPI001592B9B5|nr:fosfomycin resistance glutathione transferase [Duganella sp. BJB1802]